MVDRTLSARRRDEAEVKALVEALADSGAVAIGVVALLADDYRIVRANRATAELLCPTLPGLEGVSARSLGLSQEEVRPHLDVLWRVRRSGAPETLQFVFGPTVPQRWFSGTLAPLPGDEAHVAFMLVDITANRIAEAAALHQGARLSLALEASNLGLWDYDLEADRVDWDPRMRRMFGAPPEGDVSFSTYAKAVHPDDFPAVEAAYSAAMGGANGGYYVVEHRVADPTGDGSAAWIRGSGRVMFDVNGRPTHVIGTAQDISAQMAAAQRQEFLVAELNHRVKNNLAAVQAIVAQTMRRNGDDPATFKLAIEARIQSLARSHDLLIRNVWERADLSDVVGAALAPFGAERFKLSGPRKAAPLPPQMAVDLVMILNELATNAAKYGALSTDGRVEITWRIAQGRFELTWRERGGPPVAPPSRQGFGTRLTMSAMAGHGGGAQIDYRPDGVTYRLAAPIWTGDDRPLAPGAI